mgnify:FL=1
MINSNRKIKTNTKAKENRSRLSKEERKEKAIAIAAAIESATIFLREGEHEHDKTAAEQLGKKNKKSKRVSIRFTDEQYKFIEKKCKNSNGEQLITITDFVRQSAISTKNIINAHEHPLDRFKLAISSEIAAGITDVVHFIDTDLDQRSGNYDVDDCREIITRLEAIEEVASYLLIPTEEEAKCKDRRIH